MTGQDTVTDLQPLFAPRSIALIGASADPSKLSGAMLRHLRHHGYPGRLYPINPRVREINGVRCYPSLAAVGEPIDLAVILLGAGHTAAVLDECVANGAKVAVACASGFAETGATGRARQAALLERIAGSGLRLLGPNCMGVVNVRERVAASFSQSLFVERLLPGHLAFLSQSGAIAGSVTDLATARQIGLSHWVATGNQADLDVVECAGWLLDQPDVHVVGLYLEGLNSPERYLALLRAARARGKPVLVLKSGESEVGTRAAASHTGALAGDGDVFRAVTRQAGALVVHDVEELLDLAQAFFPGHVATGRQIGVVSASGGVGMLLADAAERHALLMATLSDTTRERLGQIVPPYGSTSNPVDTTATLAALSVAGARGQWRDCFLAVAEDPSVECLVIGLTMITGQSGVRLAKEVIETAKRTAKPVLVAWLGGDLCRDAFGRLLAAGIPLYASTARAMRAAAALAARNDQPDAVGDSGSPASLDIATLDLPPAAALLAEWECIPLLQAAGIPSRPGGLVRSAGEAEAAARAFGRTVVLKVQSPDIPHKTDVGGIRLDVRPRDAAGVYSDLLAAVGRRASEARILGVLIQPQAYGGVEALVGVTRDPQFGLMLACGPGGVLVEAFGTPALRRLPLSRIQAEAMLAETPLGRLLSVARGGASADRAALVNTLLRVAQLAEALGERLLDLEINPLRVGRTGEGVLALDCLVQLSPADSSTH